MMRDIMRACWPNRLPGQIWSFPTPSHSRTCASVLASQAHERRVEVARRVETEKLAER